jgi:hypothetical protein
MSFHHLILVKVVVAVVVIFPFGTCSGSLIDTSTLVVPVVVLVVDARVGVSVVVSAYAPGKLAQPIIIVVEGCPREARMWAFG